jgi:transcriptional regulator with XRE-family HTH domain
VTRRGRRSRQFEPFTRRRAARIAGALLRNARSGTTQEAVGRRLGWPQSVVSRIESGDRAIGLEDFVRYCEALDSNSQEMFQQYLQRRDGVVL